jgi:hypothetical protein
MSAEIGWNRLRSLGLVVALLHATASSYASDETSQDLQQIAAELRRQDRAYNDITVTYVRTSFVGNDRSTPYYKTRWTWMRSADGYERVDLWREGKEVVKPYREAASYLGDLGMTFDGQAQTGGGIGAGVYGYIGDPEVPRIYGMVLEGSELGLPITYAEFLVHPHAACVAKRVDGLIEVQGKAVQTEGRRYRLLLDPKFGYRPVRIEEYDYDKLHVVHKDIAYQEFTGKRGSFHFATRATCEVFRDGRMSGNGVHEVEQIQVDRGLKRDDFVLTFPRGALVLNYDSGVNGYLIADSKPGDEKNFFAGKLISIAEHDRLQALGQDLPTLSQVKGRSGWSYFALSLTVVLIALLVLTFWHFRVRRPGAALR